MLSETKFANTDFPDWYMRENKRQPYEFNAPKPQRTEEHGVAPSTPPSLDITARRPAPLPLPTLHGRSIHISRRPRLGTAALKGQARAPGRIPKGYMQPRGQAAAAGLSEVEDSLTSRGPTSNTFTFNMAAARPSPSNAAAWGAERGTGNGGGRGEAALRLAVSPSRDGKAAHKAGLPGALWAVLRSGCFSVPATGVGGAGVPACGAAAILTADSP